MNRNNPLEAAGVGIKSNPNWENILTLSSSSAMSFSALFANDILNPIENDLAYFQFAFNSGLDHISVS